MKPNKDEFVVEILPDGVLKITTGKFSPALHVSADGFLLALEKILNPSSKDVKPNYGVHRVGHSHSHDHDHGHSH